METLTKEIELWPPELHGEFLKSVSVVKKVEGERIGALMFLYKDTFGLTKQSIDIAIEKATESEEYKKAFTRLVVLDMLKRKVMTTAQSQTEGETV